MMISDWPNWAALILGLVGGLSMGLLFNAHLLCKHAWEFVDKTEVPSFMEQFKMPLESLEFDNIDPKELSRRTVVIVLRCPKCGRAKVHQVS